MSLHIVVLARCLFQATDGDSYGGAGGDADLGSLLDTGKFKADRGFAGTERIAAEAGGRTKPIEFQKAPSDGDAFGIDRFTSASSRGNALDKIGSQVTRP